MSDARDALSIDGLLVHRRFVRALARALVRDESAADDLEQETWLRACQSPPSENRGLRGWLKRVVRNAAGDARRSEGRRDDRERRAASPEAEPSADAIAARLEIEKRLVAAVESLDERYRRVVFLRFFEELPPRVAAKRLAIPVDTVRTQTARALEQLRKKLDEAHGGARRDWISAMAPLAFAPVSVAPLVAWAAAAVVVLALSVPAWRTLAAAAKRPAAAEPSASGLAAAVATDSTAPAKSSPPDDGVATVVAEPAAAGSVSGTVVGSLRTPLADAEVELRGDYGSTAHLSTRSKDDGRFHFARVPFGFFWLSARKAGCVAAQQQLTVDANGPDVTDLRLTLWRARDLRGVVVDAGGAPVAGAQVVASFEDLHRRWPTTSGTTGADGRFTVRDVPLHPLLVSVFAAAHVPLRQHGVRAGDGEARLTLSPDAPALLRVTLAAGTGVDLAHGVGAPVHLRVAPFTNTVSADRDHAIWEFREEVDLPAGSTSLDLPDLVPGPYEILATCDGAEIRPQTQRVTAARDEPSTASITVDAIHLPIEIRGRVVSEDGVPIPGARFSASPYDDPSRQVHVVADEHGAFSCVSATGSHGMVCFVPEDSDHMFSSDSTFNRRIFLPVVAGTPIDLTLVTCERMTGRVVDSSGRAITGCEVHLMSDARPSGTLAQSHLDADGRFELKGTFAKLPLVVWLIGDLGTYSQPLEPKFVPGERRDDVVLRIARLARIRGRVVDEEGHPIAGAWVRAIPEAARRGWPGDFWFLVLATAITDEEGRFALDSIQPSTTKIGIGADPHSSSDVVEIPIAIAEGEERDDVVFTLPRSHAAPGRIRVRVEWDDGTPEPEAMIYSPPTSENAHQLDRSAIADFVGPASGTQGLYARFADSTAQGTIYVESEVVQVASGGQCITLTLKRPALGRARATLPDTIRPADLSGLQIRALLPPRAGTTVLSMLVAVPWSVDGSTLALGPISAGHYGEISFEGPSLRRLRCAVDVVADQTTDLGLLKLEPLASIETRVTDATGAPIGDAEFDEHADLLLLDGRSLSTRTTLRADEAGLIDVPGNSDRGVFRAPGFAPCQWHRTVNKPGSVVLLREATLRLRDVPDEARTNPSPWHFAVEVWKEEISAASYPHWLLYDASVISLARDLVPHLPATRVTVHFWRNDDVALMKMPERPEPGRYYRIDAMLVADEVTDVSIAPGR